VTRLSRLLRALGARELARRLGRSPSTVQRWTRAGVPAAAKDDLWAVDKRRAAARAAAKARQEKLAAAQRAAAEKRAKAEKAAAEKRAKAEKARKEKVEREQAETKKRERAKAEKARKEKAERERARKEKAEREKRERAEAERRRTEEIARRAREKKEKAEREEKARREAEARQRAEEERKKRFEAEKKRKEEERKKKQVEQAEEVERRRKVLVEACKLMTSNRSIADAIGVDEATIRRWMKGAPKKSPAFERLERLVLSVHTLAELMKQAGVVEHLPKVRSGHGRRSGRKTEGVYWTKAFMTVLDPESLKEIVKWVAAHFGNYPFWQAVAVTSQYALGSEIDFHALGPKSTDRDYKTIYVQLGGKGKREWGDFAADRPEPTGQRRSATEAAADLKNRLGQRMQSGAVHVFIHAVTLFAYRRRTKEEETRWETTQRRQRREQWEQKTKSKKTGRTSKQA
jgi:chemotaxis protein histidine kinase CheA